jgi:glucokinase
MNEVVAERFALGVDFGGTTIKMGLVNGSGELLERRKIDTSKADTPESWLDAVDRGVDALAKVAGLARGDLAGMGVGIPGFIDFQRGHIFTLPNVPGWDDVHFVRMAEDRLGMRVFADNDVNVMALGECTFGAGRLYRHAVFMTLGTGVGGALLLDGRLYRGGHSLAGEIGHMSIDMNGTVSPTGRGVLESYIGNRRLVERAVKAMEEGASSSLRERVGEAYEGLTVKMIAEEAARGDELSCEIFDFAATCLATACSSLAYILQPQAFIVGGGVSRSGEALFGPLRKHLKERLSPVFLDRLEIKRAKLGNQAGMIGAACLPLMT